MSITHNLPTWHFQVDYRVSGALYAIGPSPAWNPHPVAFVMATTHADDKATARLFAAAPEMFNALEDVLLDADAADKPLLGETTLARCRAAFNKAKGIST